MPELTWLGKEAVRRHHHEVPFRLLREVPGLSSGDPGAGNMIVQGDNLAALKALLPYYARQVKCIYIDPPYNTGNEGWVYNDAGNAPEIRAWREKVVGREGEDLSRHDKWLCMMYPRLALLREFLREDGAIFISIDDNEVHALRYLMDEIFGPQNFVVNMIWQKMDSPSSNYGPRAFSNYHDHTLIFARSAEKCRLNPRSKSDILDAFPDIDGEGNRCRLRQLRKNGNAKREDRPSMWYPILDPDGKEMWPIHPEEKWEGRWTVGKSTYERLAAENAIRWKQRPYGWMAYTVEYPSENPTIPNPSILMDAGQNRQAKAQLNDVLGTDHGFDTPKPVGLIERILQIATNPGDLVLDSFAGSGTTGRAVLKMNAAAVSGTAGVPPASDGLPPEGASQAASPQPALSLGVAEEGATPSAAARMTTLRGTPVAHPAAEVDLPPRRFILVEIESKIAREITAERVRRVAEVYTNAKGDAVTGLGGSFRFAELGEELFDARGHIAETVRFTDLARHVYFTETGVPLPAAKKSKSPRLGIHRGTAIYLLYNGILGDKSVDAGNVLTSTTLALLPPHPGPKVVYANGCRFSPARLAREGIVFKQLPYQIKVR